MRPGHSRSLGQRVRNRVARDSRRLADLAPLVDCPVLHAGAMAAIPEGVPVPLVVVALLAPRGLALLLLGRLRAALRVLLAALGIAALVKGGLAEAIPLIVGLALALRGSPGQRVPWAPRGSHAER